MPEGAVAKYVIRPAPADLCTIRAYSQSGGAPAVFPGEVFLPAIKPPAGHFRAQIRTKFFTLDYQEGSSGGKGRFGFTTHPEVTSTSRFSLDDWRNYFRLFAALGGEQTQIEVAPTKLERLIIPVSKHIDERQLAEAHELVLACDDINSVLDLAGINAGEFSFHDLTSLVPEMRIAAQVLAKQPEGIPLSYASPYQSEYGPLDLLYLNGMRLANVVLACGAVVTMIATPEAGKLIWRPTTVVARPRVSQIADDEQAYRKFIEEFKAATGLVQVVTLVAENGVEKP